ncbi:MAG: DUF5063 domain-containing protein [Bacteroidales bacterium]|nr:DUF5063 domain-containing protein [Bacteroidales bacterium]
MDIYSDKSTLEFVTVATEFCAFVEKAKKFSKKDFVTKLHKMLALIYLKTTLLIPFDEAVSEGEVEAYLSEYEYEYIKRNVSFVLGSSDSFISIYNVESVDGETEQAELSDCVADVYHNLKNFVENYRSLSEESAKASRAELLSDFKEYWGVKLLSLLSVLHNLVYFADLDEEDFSKETPEAAKNFYSDFIDNYHKKI